MANNEIKLIVKAPNQKINDQTIVCGFSWTVLQLKEHISLVYPSKPRVEEQRLIYSGHLLRNEQILSDILEPNQGDNIFIVHLVCSQKLEFSMKSSSATNDRNGDESQRTDESQNLFNPNMSAFQWNNAMNTFGFPSAIANPEQMAQQLALMQQMYTQYMSQYFQQTGVNSENLPFLPQNTNQTPSVAMPTQTETGTNRAMPPPEAQAPQVQRMNAAPAGPALDDEEEDRNRDWLEWFYWLSRSVVFVSILYFYSSFSRFLIVIGFGLLFYLYQNGLFLNANREDRQQQPNAEERDARREQEILAANVDAQRRQNNDRPTEERFSGLRLIWIIISSLFTSLIPEQPAPVNLN